MSNYTPTYTNAAGVIKDATHTPVLGADIGTEFDAIQTAVNSKADTASPTLVTPVLGVATATSINKVTITAPATSAILTIADGKTATISNTLTFVGTDSTTITFPTTSATIARTDAANTFTGTQTITGLCDLSNAAAGQIKFPATQNPSADANTLDDYEEGAWTPTLTGFGGTGLAAAGEYIKVGKLVHWIVDITGTDCTSTANTSSFDLPFAAASIHHAGNCIAASTSTVSYGVGIAGGVQTMQTPTWAATSRILVSGSYRAAA